MKSPQWPRTNRWLGRKNSQVVELWVTHLELEACFRDTVQLYDGHNSSSPLLATYCGSGGNNRKKHLTSTSTAYVLFQSDGAGTRHGFQLQYSAADRTDKSEGCPDSPKMISRESGRITYPPGNKGLYPNQANCSWLVSVPQDKVIHIHFLTFKLESCWGDTVTLYDGDNTHAPIIAQLCGSNAQNYTTSGSSLFMLFESDIYGRTRGFSAEFQSVTKTVERVPLHCLDEVMYLYDEAGIIYSPNYAQGQYRVGSYPNNVQCHWTIIGSPDKVIVLEFVSFQVEFHPNCACDYFAITDDGFEKRLCGKGFLSNYTSSTNLLDLAFVSDSRIADKGFKIKYYTLSVDACPLGFSIIRESTGFISSPNYARGLPYPTNSNCRLLILAPKNKVVILRIIHHWLDNPNEMVHIYDSGGPRRPSPKRSHFLTGVREKPYDDLIRSSGNRLFLYFNSSSIMADSLAGFLAEYWTENPKAQCSKPAVMNGSVGIIQHPFDDSAMHSTDLTTFSINPPSTSSPVGTVSSSGCIWTIKAQSSQIIRLTVSYLSIVCFRYLRVQDGSGGKLLLQKCGQFGEVSLKVSSSGPLMVIRADQGLLDFSLVAAYRTTDDVNLYTSIRVPPTSCGVPGPSRNPFLITNGIDAPPHRWPWQVAIYRRDRFRCGGSIIHPRYILTAAHCLWDFTNWNYPPASVFTIRVGSNLRSGGIQYQVLRHFVPPGEETSHKMESDLAIFELTTDLILSPTIRPICLPSVPPKNNKACYLTGWGQISYYNPNLPDKLQEAPVRIVNKRDCKENYWKDEMERGNLCVVGNATGQRSCKGDSGGPLSCEEGGRFYLYGLVSRGKCATSQHPSLMADVFYFRDWILSIIGSQL